MFESSIPQEQQRSRRGKRSGLRYPAPLRVERRLRRAFLCALELGSQAADLELAALDASIRRRAVSHLRFRFSAIRRMRERSWAKIRFAPTTPGSRSLVPARTLRSSGSTPPHFAPRPPTRSATSGATRSMGPACRPWTCAVVRDFVINRTLAFPDSRRVFQRLEPHQSGYAEPLRQHAAVRNDNRCRNPGREIQLSARLSFRTPASVLRVFSVTRLGTRYWGCIWRRLQKVYPA